VKVSVKLARKCRKERSALVERERRRKTCCWSSGVKKRKKIQIRQQSTRGKRAEWFTISSKRLPSAIELIGEKSQKPASEEKRKERITTLMGEKGNTRNIVAKAR